MEGNSQQARDKNGRLKKGFTSFSTGCDINNSIDVNNNETQTYVDDVNSGLELDHCENDSEELSRSTYTNIFDGRRIVEFSVLVDHLERGCVVCHKPLN